MAYQSYGTVAHRDGQGTTTADWPLSRAIPAGRQLVLWAFDVDGQGGTPAYISDPRGNTWVMLGTHSSITSLNASTKIFGCQVVNPYSAGDSISVASFGVFGVPRVGLVREYSGLDVTSAAGAAGRGSGTSYSLGPVTPPDDRLAVGGINAYNNPSISGSIPSVGVDAPFSVVHEGVVYTEDAFNFDYFYAKAVEWEPTTATPTTFSGAISPSSTWAGVWAYFDLLPAADGVDLVALATGHILGAYKPGSADSAEVGVDISRDKGASWEGQTVATDGATDGAPTLCVTQWDEVFLFYHNSLKRLRRWRSLDDGATWTDLGTLSDRSYEYPKAVTTLDGLLVMANYSATVPGLQILRSTNEGAAWTSVLTFAAERQRATIARDRHGILHLVYKSSGGQILHRRSLDGGLTWSAGLQMGTLTGDTPSYAIGPTNQALLTYFDPLPLSPSVTALWVWTTEEDYETPGDVQHAQLTDFHVPQWLGVLIDEEDTMFLIGRLETPEPDGGFDGGRILVGTGETDGGGGFTFEEPS